MALLDCLFACLGWLIQMFSCPTYRRHAINSVPQPSAALLPSAGDEHFNSSIVDRAGPSHIEAPLIPLRKQQKPVSKSIPSASMPFESYDTSRDCSCCSICSNQISQTRCGDNTSEDIDSIDMDTLSSQIDETPKYNSECSLSSIPSAINCPPKMVLACAKSDQENVKYDLPDIFPSYRTTQNFIIDIPEDAFVSSEENGSTNGSLKQPNIIHDLIRGTEGNFVEDLPKIQASSAPIDDSVSIMSPEYVMDIPDNDFTSSNENGLSCAPIKQPNTEQDLAKRAIYISLKHLLNNVPITPIANEINLSGTSMTVPDNTRNAADIITARNLVADASQISDSSLSTHAVLNGMQSSESASGSVDSSENGPPTTSVAKCIRLKAMKRVRFKENNDSAGASDRVLLMNSPNNEAGGIYEPYRKRILRPYGLAPRRIEVRHDMYGRAYYYSIPDPSLESRFGNKYSNGYNSN